ncbi:MAG: hypothetical protein K8F91_10120 [Candidatus Obscuribacterales bacterium]|nr:hypothetical protein [Candidatus Obscuribacterales bacterium]
MKVDEFVGEYYQCGSYTAELAKAKKVTIVKDKDVCRIKGVKVWDSCRFVVHGDNRLRDSKKHIGDLVLGEMKFPDERGARKVLRADFCYDYFVLVSTRPTN